MSRNELPELIPDVRQTSLNLRKEDATRTGGSREDGEDAASVIHIFEPTGYAGIFQHAYELARLLSTRPDLRVILHTSRQHEVLTGDGVNFCTCCWWPRGEKRGGLTGKLRQAAIAARLLFVTLPHLVLTVKSKSIFHLQGVGAHGLLNLLIVTAVRMRGCRVVYSPHDTFSRKGSIDGKLLRLAYRPVHAVVVYSRAEERRLSGLGERLYPAPLIHPVVRPSDELIRKWRREWSADVVILCPGFIRSERRLDLLIESACNWPIGWRLAVVGEDRGSWAAYNKLAEERHVDISARIGFIDLEEFTAAIAAADLVVVPSEQASQSGVLVLARQLGTPSVAANVGGMAEQASRTFVSGDVDELTAAIDAELGRHEVTAASNGVADIRGYLRAYDIN